MTHTQHLSRRDLIKLITQGFLALSGALGLGGLLRFLSYRPEPPAPNEFNLGLADQYPPGSRTLRGEIPAVITNIDGEIQATSLICSHLGCTLLTAADGSFECPCHGSRFDDEGRVLAGPAQKSLARLRIQLLEDGTLKLFAG